MDGGGNLAVGLRGRSMDSARRKSRLLRADKQGWRRGALRGGGGLWGGGGGEEGEALGDVEAGAAKELVNDGFGEAGGIVLDEDGAFGFAEIDAADTVDLAQAGDSAGGGLGGLGAVAEDDVDGGHRADFSKLEFGEVIGDLGAGPVLGSDELAAEDAVSVDDVGFGDLDGAVEGIDAAIGIADGDEVYVMLDEESVVDLVVLVGGDGDDGELGVALFEGEQAGELFDAGSAPGGPEVEDDDVAAVLGEVD